jgi:hypothetical protein
MPLRILPAVSLSIWFLVALGVPCRPAAAASQEGENVTVLGAGFTATPFALAGDVILETDGLWNAVRDYRDPVHPTWLGWQNVSGGSGFWQDVLYEDGLVAALLTQVAAGVVLVDFSDPANPVEVGGLSGLQYSSGLLHQRLLYLTTTNVLLVYDLQQPAAPSLRFALSLAPHEGPRWLCRSGSRVFFIESQNVVRCLDIADPLAIQDLGTATLDADRIDALAAGEGALYALLADTVSPQTTRLDLATYDVATAPQLVQTQRQLLVAGTAARGLQLRRADGLLLASENREGLHALDLTDPLQPACGYQLPLRARHLAISENLVFALTADRLSILERTPPCQPPAVLTVRRILPEFGHVSGDGSVLLAQSSKERGLLYVIDASNPAQPVISDDIDTGYPGQLVRRGPVALLHDRRGFQLVDLVDPTQPAARGELRFEDDALQKVTVLAPPLAACGDFSSFAIYLYDLSDLDRPTLIGTLQEQNVPLAMNQRVLLVRNLGNLEVFEITDPQQPFSHGHIPLLGPAVRGEMVGDLAYLVVLVSGSPLLQVVDLADPARPTVTASVPLQENGRLLATDRRLYVHGFNRVQLLDLADPQRPVPAGWFRPAFSPQQTFAAHEDHLIASKNLITARDESWTAAAVRPAASVAACRLELPFPNPANPAVNLAFDLDRERELSLSVYDARGRRVAELRRGTFGPGRHAVTWPGRDQQGRPVASGVYLVRLSAAGLEAVQTVTLVR